jgi:hypothetical protein
LERKAGVNINGNSIKEHHNPLFEKLKQIEHSMLDLQAEIDATKVLSLENSQVLFEARNLNQQWDTFNQEEKKNIIAAITTSIIVGKEDILINLAYMPILNEEKDKKSKKDDTPFFGGNSSTSSTLNTTENQFYTLGGDSAPSTIKFLNLSNESSGVRSLCHHVSLFLQQLPQYLQRLHFPQRFHM